MTVTISYKDIRDEKIRDLLDSGLILDLGGGRPWKTGWLHTQYQEQLQKSAYCMDFRRENSPHLVGDIQQLPFQTDSVDGIICNAVLEHIPEPYKAVEEILRILKPGGKVFIYAPFLYPYHDQIDYYRFTVDALAFLFRNFQQVTIQPAGSGYLEVIMSFMVFYRKPYSQVASWLSHPVQIIFRGLWRLLHRGSDLSKIDDILLLRNNHGYYVYAKK